MSSIYWSLHDFSQQDFNLMRSLTYIHVTHLTFYGRTLKHVRGEKGTPRQEHAHLLGIA